ncbi:MAG: Crp/Fnr family transcriptional regulator [Acidobacteria bacterium]|nr:Crp/Fnr family transcriptional regulator [Acidobacteriota bacterium]
MSTQEAAQERIGNRLLAKLPPEELEFLRPHLERVSLAHGDILISPHEPVRYLYFPLTALGSLVTIMEDGSTVESGTAGREGLIGVPALLDAGETTMQTLAQIPGEALRIKASVCKSLLDQGGAFHKLFHRYIHTLFIVASQSAACNRLHRVEARLCRWLLMSSDGVGSHELDLTQEFLSAMLGVRRAGVTEAALKIQAAGLIHYLRGHITILNREGLEAAACECYRVVRDEYDRLLG